MKLPRLPRQQPSAGTVSVTVTSAGSTTVTTSADEFTYSAQPFVTSISPASGPVSGKTKVTVTGAQLTAATKVSFGGTPGTGVSVSSARALSVMSPARAAGTVYVTVTTPQGASPISPSAGFTYVPPPTVTKVTPASGPVTGQTSVTVTGTSLGGASAVYFGAVRAASVAAVSATRLTAVAPAEKAGTVNVTVTTPGGTSAASSADRFLFTGPAPVSRVTATATTSASVTLAWKNPVSGSYSGVMVRRAADAPRRPFRRPGSSLTSPLPRTH